MIEVLVQCREELQSALFQYWQEASFGVRTDHKNNATLAAVVLSLPNVSSIPIAKGDGLDVWAAQTKALLSQLQEREQRPSVCIVLSSVDVYDKQQEEIHEASVLDNHGFAQGILSFEADCRALEKVGIRVVVLRLGQLMSPLGSLKNFQQSCQDDGLLSWVHIDDVCRCVDLCVRQNIPSGVYNLVAPTMAIPKGSVRFSLQGAKTFAKKFWNKGTEGKVRTTTVHAQKIVQSGFIFSHTSFVESLEKTYSF